jgi:hypothetical protein
MAKFITVVYAFAVTGLSHNMRRFVLGWKKLGHEKRLKAYIVNYADDLVICCRNRAEEASVTMRALTALSNATLRRNWR